MLRLTLPIILVALALHALPAAAQPSNVEDSVVTGAQSFTIDSKYVREGFRIHVGLPPSYFDNPEQTYPVIYRTDANLNFDSLYSKTKALQLDVIEPGFPEVIVVGIAYPNPSEWMVKRQRDMTPEGTVSDIAVAIYRDGKPGTIFKGLPGLDRYRGGADDFLKFITDELDPVVRKAYRTDGKRAGLFGASYGGLFSYYAFLKRTPLFNRYWIGSVGIVTKEGRYLIDQLPTVLNEGPFDDVRICMTLGEKEIGDPFYGEVSVSYNQILTILNAKPTSGLTVGSRVIPDATHYSSEPAAEMEALLFLYHPKHRN